MKLGSAGEAFFLRESLVLAFINTFQDNLLDNEYKGSPLMSSGEVSPRNYSSGDEET